MSETVVVPREPTEAMLQAAIGVRKHIVQTGLQHIGTAWSTDIWTAMLAASPAPVDEPKPADDLVERANKIVDHDWNPNAYDNRYEGIQGYRNLKRAIASALSAERKKVEELEALAYTGQRAYDDGGRITWLEEAKRFERREAAAESRNRVLSEAVDRLRKALEPFGKIDLSNAPGTQVAISNAGGTYGYLYLVDFTVARTALEQS